MSSCQALGMRWGEQDGCDYKAVAWEIFVVMEQLCILIVVVVT